MNVIVLVKISYIETLFSIEDVAKIKKIVQIKNKKIKKIFVLPSQKYIL